MLNLNYYRLRDCRTAGAIAVTKIKLILFGHCGTTGAVDLLKNGTARQK